MITEAPATVGGVKATVSWVLPVVTDEIVGAEANGLTTDASVITPVLAFRFATVVTRNRTESPGVREGTEAFVAVETPSFTHVQVVPLSRVYSTR